MSLHYIIEILLVFIIFIVSYFKSYAQQKGANLATKEDIGRITTIVENIKFELTTTMEVMKAELTVKGQHKLNLKNAEINAIINFNREIAKWYYHMESFNLFYYDVENYKDLKDEDKQFNVLEKDCNVAGSELELFYGKDELWEVRNNLEKKILDYKNSLSISMQKLFFIISAYDNEKNSPVEELRNNAFSTWHDSHSNLMTASKDERAVKKNEVIQQLIVLKEALSRKLKLLEANLV